MSTVTLLVRFALTYLGLLVVAAVLARVVGRDSFALLNAISLFAAVNLVCTARAARVGRYFDARERLQVWLLFAVVALAIQGLLVAIDRFVLGAPVGPASDLLLHGVVPVAHVLVVGFGIWLTGRNLERAGSRRR